MISSVRGAVLSTVGTTAVIEVGGVGLAMTLTPKHALSLRVGSEAVIRTALIVREDVLALYGFQETEQLLVFDLLRGVTGVGPKSAMGVLSMMSPDEIAHAVNADDDAAFKKVSGIGPKTAKLIVVSLTGKLVVQQRAASGPASDRSGQVSQNVSIALTGLGWSDRVAEDAAKDAFEAASPAQKASVPELLRLALAMLGPAQHSERHSPDRSGGQK